MSEQVAATTTLTSPEFKQKLASLFAYLVGHLGIKQAPKVKLVNSRENANNILGKTGYYDDYNKLIVIYMTNRHPKDQLRSFAHECIHHWQNEHGRLFSPSNDPQYAQNNPHLRQMEMQAFLLGNILFRDWEDQFKK